MTTVTITEWRHGGHGAIFVLDGLRYYVPTCCGKAEVVLVDEDTRRCKVVCADHKTIARQYDPALTDAERAAQSERLASVPAFNPATDPHGEKQQRRRKSGTTMRWYQARGL